MTKIELVVNIIVAIIVTYFIFVCTFWTFNPFEWNVQTKSIVPVFRFVASFIIIVTTVWLVVDKPWRK